MRYDTETNCHCGADYRGSDHCPECGCEQYESDGCGHTAATSYPYNAGDRVMLGIATWQSPHRYSPTLDKLRAEGADLSALADQERAEGPVYGPSGPYCRYFVPATVVANDRQDGILVLQADDRLYEYDIHRFEDWNGEEVVPFDHARPQTATAAHKRALFGQSY